MKVNSQKTTQFPELCDQRPMTLKRLKIQTQAQKTNPRRSTRRITRAKKNPNKSRNGNIYYRETKRFTLNTRESKKDKVVGGQ